MWLGDNLMLLDWAGRQVTGGKAGSVPESAFCVTFPGLSLGMGACKLRRRSRLRAFARRSSVGNILLVQRRREDEARAAQIGNDFVTVDLVVHLDSSTKC